LILLLTTAQWSSWFQSNSLIIPTRI
jgi:hypothetical protein